MPHGQINQQRDQQQERTSDTVQGALGEHYAGSRDFLVGNERTLNGLSGHRL